MIKPLVCVPTQWEDYQLNLPMIFPYSLMFYGFESDQNLHHSKNNKNSHYKTKIKNIMNVFGGRTNQ